VYSEAVTSGIDQGAQVVAPEVVLATADLAAYVIAVRHNRSGAVRFVATGDGMMALYPVDGTDDTEPLVRYPLSALPLCLAADVDDQTVLLGCDDGTLRRLAADGRREVLFEAKSGWIENVATTRQTGLRAFSVARKVNLLDASGEAVAYFADLPSTPTGLAFSPDGKRLAVARYNGVSIWDLGSGSLINDLFWRGSHTAVAWSPDGRYIVTATQDRDLHCWRLPDGKDFKMSGYPSKIRSIGWTSDSKYVCASGADTVTSWHCDEGGPGGKPALELGFVFNGTVTQVAPHPQEDLVAAGYDDGTVLIGDIVKGDALIAKPPGGGAVSCIDWAPDGRSLAVGTQGGTYAAIRLDL
jgi:WD40 repeat protein